MQIIYSIMSSFEPLRSILITVDPVKKSAHYLVYSGNFMDWSESPPYGKNCPNEEHAPPIPMPFSEAHLLWEALQTCPIFPAPETTAGLDGVTYELVLSAGFNCSTLRWWGSLPPEWVALHSTINKLDQLIP